MTFARARSTLRYRGLGMADSILSSVIRLRPRAGLSQPSARPPSPSETKHALITRTATSRGNMAGSSTIIRGRRGGNDNLPIWLGLAEADYRRFLAPDLAFEELDARPHGIR